MKPKTVSAPASLLLHPELLPSAKLVWLVLRLHAPSDPVGSGELEDKSGLSRPTILKALARLLASGWCVAVPGGHTATDGSPSLERSAPAVYGAATMPGDLLLDRRIRPQFRVLYGILQLTPKYRDHEQGGEFGTAALGKLAGACPTTVRRAVRELTQTRWLDVTQANRLAPIRFTIGNPVAARAEAEEAQAEEEAARARRRVNRAEHKGEALMREFIWLLIESEDYIDNLRPGFLVNPLTDERMELDRFYEVGVAFEFNGRQHDVLTDLATPEELRAQRARDYFKLAICVTRGIKMVVIHPNDLSLETMRRKVGDLLPLRDLKGHEPLIRYLQTRSRQYRESDELWREMIPVPVGKA